MLTRNDPLANRPLLPDRRTKGGSFARAVGSFVPKVAGKAFEKFGFHTAEIMTQWPRIAGDELASWTAPDRIRWPRIPAGMTDAGTNRPGGTLVLRVEPAHALDVEYRSADIIDRVNRYFGYRAVGSLKLIQAPLNISHAFSQGAANPRLTHARAGKNFTFGGSGAVAPVSLPAELASLPDDGLKAALARLWSAVSSKS